VCLLSHYHRGTQMLVYNLMKQPERGGICHQQMEGLNQKNTPCHKKRLGKSKMSSLAGRKVPNKEKSLRLGITHGGKREGYTQNP